MALGWTLFASCLMLNFYLWMSLRDERRRVELWKDYADYWEKQTNKYRDLWYALEEKEEMREKEL